MLTIQKQLTNQDQTKKDLAKVVQKSRWCWQFSSIIVVLCITNSFQLAKILAKRNRNYGLTTLGFCTTIMLRRTLSWVFRQKLDPCCSTTNVFTWFSVISGCFRTSRDHCGEMVLSRLKRSNVKRYEHWRLYLQTTFQHAWKTGGNVEISALSWGGIILRGSM